MNGDETVYFDLTFTSWGGTGGAFSYVRASAPAPEPASAALLGLAAGLLSLRRRR